MKRKITYEHNYKEQKRETFDTFKELFTQVGTLPERGRIEYYLLAEGEETDWKKCAEALRQLGFETQENREDDTLIVSPRGDITLFADEIWRYEKVITETALPYDFMPDGWEFGFDDKD